MLNRTFIIFKYIFIFKIKNIIFNFIYMSFVFYYFEIIILINLYHFLITLYNYYKNKCESGLHFYTIKI